MYKPFSSKQMQIMTWWTHPVASEHDAIIADGSIRAGKTLCMSTSFLLWAMTRFDNMSFAICGKTVTSCQRNVITPLLNEMQSTMSFKSVTSRNYIECRYNGKCNRFYIFGGKDEGSAALIQGMTLAGILLDEVALMPRSFVEQGLGRCSVEGSKFWFNCNPEHPLHWFFTEWICKRDSKRALYVHFTMNDNPTISDKVRKRYESLFTGIFYDRYIKGEWVAPTGLVYPNFSDRNKTDYIPAKGRYFISIDYGIINPFSAHLWCIAGTVAYCIDEYYFDSRARQRQRTDEEHYSYIEKLAGDRYIEYIVIDPSASSFKETVYRHGIYDLRNAVNDVINGISNCMTLLDTEYIKINPACVNMIKEFSLYSWDADSGKDQVLKVNDHAMDGFRYFVNTILVDEFSHVKWGKKDE